MLSIGHVRAGNQAQRAYHERQLVEGRDDYYQGAEGPPGIWIGSLTDRVGVRGQATVADFGRLLDGKIDAVDAEPFGGALKRAVLAFDLTFSAPKSVSLLRMVVNEETAGLIDQAHEEAVRAAFATIEREAAVYNQMVDGDRGTHRSTDGLVGVLYRHETSRNADPQLHGHLVLMNLIRRADGSYSALNNRQLYRLAATFGSIYEAVLRGELHRSLGIEFDTPVKGIADIRGFDPALLERYATRRAEILAAMRDLQAQGIKVTRYATGDEDPVRKGRGDRVYGGLEAITLETRHAKDRTLDHATWRIATRQRLQREGLTPDAIKRFLHTTPDHDPRSIAERVAQVDLDTLTDREAHVDGAAVLRRGLDVPDGFTRDEVQEAIDRILNDDRLAQIRTGDREDLRTRRFTTKQHLSLERRVAELTVGRAAQADERVPAVDPAQAARLRETGPAGRLSADQERVAEALLTSGRRVEIVAARAGSGKTTLAGIVRDRFERAGYNVSGLAPTHQAVAEMHDAGIQTLETLARASYQDGQFSTIVRGLGPQSVVMIDEAGMAQTAQVAPLLERAAEVGAKVIMIGDDRQLPAVGAGGWFRYAIEHRDAAVLHLGEVHRQQGASPEEGRVERSRLGLLHAGNPRPWLRWAERTGRLAIAATIDDGYAETLRRFGHALDQRATIGQVAVLVPTNAHRLRLNELLRRELVDRGLLDTTHQRQIGQQLLTPGDRLVSGRNVRTETGHEMLRNGEQFTVTAIHSDGVQVRVTAGYREGQDLTLPAMLLTGRAPAVGHAYARTVHRAQGITTERVVVFAPGITGLAANLAYVALSRTRTRTDLVTVGHDRQQTLKRLDRRLRVRSDQEMALGLLRSDDLTNVAGNPTQRDLEDHRDALITEIQDANHQLQQHHARNRQVAANNQARVRVAALEARRDQQTEKVADLLLDTAAALAARRETIEAGRRPSIMSWTPKGAEGVIRGALEDLADLDTQINQHRPRPIDPHLGPHLSRIDHLFRELLDDLADTHLQIAHDPNQLTDQQADELDQLPEGARTPKCELWAHHLARALDLAAIGEISLADSPEAAAWLRNRLDTHDGAITAMTQAIRPTAPAPSTPDRAEQTPGSPEWFRDLVDLARHAVQADQALRDFRQRWPVEELRRATITLQRVHADHAAARQGLETAENARPRRRADRPGWQAGVDEQRRQVTDLDRREDHARMHLDQLVARLPAHARVDELDRRHQALRQAVRDAAEAASQPRQQILDAITAGHWPRSQHPAVERTIGSRPDRSSAARAWDQLAGRIIVQQIERNAGGEPTPIQPTETLQRDIERYRTDRGLPNPAPTRHRHDHDRGPDLER